MSNTISLEFRDHLKYILMFTLDRTAKINDTYPIEISGSSDNMIDGHYPVRLRRAQFEGCITDVLGIVHTKEELPLKVYTCAVEVGRKYAEIFEAAFKDRSSMIDLALMDPSASVY